MCFSDTFLINIFGHYCGHHLPEDGWNSDQNMLMRKVWLKYIINSELHFVGYVFIMA